MSLMNDGFADELAQQIQLIEQQTDAEIVTVLARQSDDYLYIPTLWAAFIAMLTPLVAYELGFWLEWQDIFIWQWGIWFAASVACRWTPLKMLLVPRHVRRHRAGLMARQQFLAQGLHHTRDRLGVLIFVSEAERYVEILVDQGVAARVDDSDWQHIIGNFVQQLKSGQTEAGFQHCVAQVGARLVTLFPATTPQQQLSNRLVRIQ